MPEADQVGRLRLEAPRAGTVVETAEYLAALERCYRHLSAFHEWVDDVRYWERRAPFPFPWMIPPPAVAAATEPVLQIAAVEMHSPGFWEFLGALNPLETIRKYFDDRHQRQRDREWRDPLDAERKRIENEQLKTQLVASQIQLLRDNGVPRATIRQMLTSHVTKPLGTLDRFQDSGLVGGALPPATSPAGDDSPTTPTDRPRRARRRIESDDDGESSAS